jgi:hypothetical protein
MVHTFVLLIVILLLPSIFNSIRLYRFFSCALCRYYAGVVAFRQNRWTDAAADFEAALQLSCVSPVERDFCAFVTEEAKKGALEARALADGFISPRT